MNGRLNSVFYAFVCVIALWLLLLWLAARLNRGQRGRALKIGTGVASLILPFVPVGGRPLWNWAFSIWPNPSVPLAGLIVAALGRQLFGVALFNRADWRAIWIFGAITGMLLYLHPFLLGALDLYYWGWHTVAASTGLAMLAIVFLAWGNRLGVLLLAGLMAGRLEVLESQNGWDYVVDPIFWGISCLGLGVLAYRRWWRGGQKVLGAPAQADLPAEIRD